jgi:hypothetical protein
MTDKVFSVRVSKEEYQALKFMAQKEVRTINSFLRSRIVQEARELHLLDNGQAEVNHDDMPQEDIPLEYYTPPAYEELEL